MPGVEKWRILQQGFIRSRSSDGVPVVSDIVMSVSPLFTMYGWFSGDLANMSLYGMHMERPVMSDVKSVPGFS